MTEPSLVQRVVLFLGLAALALIGGELWLIHSVIAQQKPTDSAVALIGSVATLAGTTLGALGALLVSTRSGPAPPAPVVVNQPPDQPVPVADVVPAE